MSEYDELPFGEVTTPPTMAGEPTPRKHRHTWARRALGQEGPLGEIYCIHPGCGKLKDETLSRRARNNRKRGNRIQAQRIVGLGGRNLAGNNPGWDGTSELFSYESKSGGFFSEKHWRVLRAIPAQGQQSRVLIVTDASGPGHRARSYVVVEYDEWKALHGE